MNNDDASSTPNPTRTNCNHDDSDGTDGDERGNAISLIGELHLIRSATNCVALMLESVGNGDTAHPEDTRTIPKACAAVATLIVCRLQLIEEVISDQGDPNRLAARHNLMQARNFGILSEDIVIPLEPSRTAETAEG